MEITEKMIDSLVTEVINKLQKVFGFSEASANKESILCLENVE